MSWWTELVPAFLAVLGAIAVASLRTVAKYIIVRGKADDTEKEAIEFLLEGINKAKDEIVREAKKAASDGKLTKQEISDAKIMAIQHAKAVATGPAKDLLVSWSTSKVESLIRQLLK